MHGTIATSPSATICRRNGKPCSPCWNRPPLPPNCTQFGSSEELLEAFRPGKFDLLLMDIYMDGMTGVEAVQKIREMDEAHPHRLYHHQHRAYPGELPAVGAEISGKARAPKRHQ